MNSEFVIILLQLTLFAPILGIPMIMAAGQQQAKLIAIITTLIPLTLAIVLGIMIGTNTESMANQEFLVQHTAKWFQLSGVDIKFMIGVDGVSLYIMLLTVLLFPILVIYTWNQIGKNQKLYYSMLLLMETGLLGFFMSLDMLLFYVFFEMVLIPAYFFIGVWGGPNRQKASLKFFIYTLAGSLLMLIAIIYTGISIDTGILTTDYFSIREANISPELQNGLFLGFALAFAIKVPLFPLHTWQPITYAESPTSATVILAALMSKMGTYGFIRFCLPLFPEASIAYAPVIGILAVIGIIYGAMLAISQTNLKRLLAYSSLSHLGFIILGIFAMTPESMSGAIFHMTAHGIVTAGLFLMLGMLERRYNTLEISDYQGMAKSLPKFTFLFMIMVLGSVGLPGLIGFVGEFMILIGSFPSDVLPGALAVIAAIAMILGAVYLLNMFRKVLFGELKSPKAGAEDLRGSEVSVLMPLIILIFIIGMYASPYLKLIDKGASYVSQELSMDFQDSEKTSGLSDNR